MKKKFLTVILILSALIMLLPACSSAAADGGKGSLKSITKPYIGVYECVYAKLGDRDFLEKYDFINISLTDGENIELSFKPKNGKKKSFEGTYEVDPDTREFTCDIGVLGVKYKEKTKIVNGKFTIVKNIASKPLIMRFEMK